VAGMAQLLDLAFQFGDGLFEVEEVGVHAAGDIRKARKYSGSSG
jgi:hypothetical protein